MNNQNISEIYSTGKCYNNYIDLTEILEQKIYSLFPSIINTRTKKIKLYSGLVRGYNCYIVEIYFKPPYHIFSTNHNSYRIKLKDFTWKDINTIQLLERFHPFHNSDSFSLKKLINYKYINKDELSKIHFYVNEYHRLVDNTNNVKIFNVIDTKDKKIDILLGENDYYIIVNEENDPRHREYIDILSISEEDKVLINSKIQEIDNTYIEKYLELKDVINKITKDIYAYEAFIKISK